MVLYRARPALACIIGARRAWTVEMISSEEIPCRYDGAPRGAMRKEMTDDKHLIRAGWNAGPGLVQRPGEAGGLLRRGIARGGEASPTM